MNKESIKAQKNGSKVNKIIDKVLKK